MVRPASAAPRRLPTATGDGRPAGGDGGGPITHPFELAAVDLTTTAGRWTGWIATDGARTSDWLNHSSELVIRGMQQVAPAEAIVAPALALTSSLTEHRLSPEELLFVVPPPLPANRHLRLHRRRVRIHVDMGDFRVIGHLHVRPGASTADYLLHSSRSLIPLTEVELVHLGEPEYRRQHDVLIINARHVTQMRESHARGRPIATIPATPTEPMVPGDAKSHGNAHPAEIGPGTKDALAALRVLLDTGLLDVTEFQAKRAELMERPRA